MFGIVKVFKNQEVSVMLSCVAFSSLLVFLAFLGLIYAPIPVTTGKIQVLWFAPFFRQAYTKCCNSF